MSLVIIMNGHTACLKTTISNLMQDFGIIRLSTHDLGNNVCESKTYDVEKRTIRYEKMFVALEDLLKEKKDVVLDATFAKRNWRKKVYALSKKYDSKPIILRCISSDKELIRKRMKKRITNSPEDEAKDFSLYELTLHAEEPPFDDIEFRTGKVPLLVFDSAKLKVLTKYGQGEMPSKVNEILNECINRGVSNGQM